MITEYTVVLSSTTVIINICDVLDLILISAYFIRYKGYKQNKND